MNARACLGVRAKRICFARRRNGTSVHGVDRAAAGGLAGAGDRATERVKPLRAASAVDTYVYLATRCATSGLLWGLSDAIAQKAESSQDKSISLTRVSRYAFFGCAVYTPLFVAYYSLQDTVVDSISDSSVISPLIKLSVDQLLWTPFLYLPIFFGGMALLEGLTLKQAREEALEKGWGLTPTLKANWKFWIPVNVVNYAVMPQELRIVWINICSLLWTIYLSQTRK